ncbi:MAG: hypothetical protein DRJ40_05530 [Thermoprotei archaeon]|nr:MAG: hypothetical protein DRJ40_03995 [Thermoprotei archaeon]RLE56853.1 MAG: hypothetical protein DRJ40_05530 [Thermoprotei archaeon]
MQFVKLKRRYNPRLYPSVSVGVDRLYRDLQSVRGFGGWLSHFAMYDLIRIYGFRVLRGLRLSRRIVDELRCLGLSEEDFGSEGCPYVDAALLVL